MNMRWFTVATVLLAASITVLWFAAERPDTERCWAEGPGLLPWVAVAGMLAAVLLAFAVAREAHGWSSVPAALLVGAAGLGLLCSGWLATFGQGVFTSGCV
jgi:hypothetical protein